MSRGGQATLGDSFGGDEEPAEPTRSQRPERRPTRSPTRSDPEEAREDPDDDARDEATQEAVEDDEEDDDYLPSPEDMDPARVEDDEDGSTSRTRGTPGSRKTEWGPCKSCGEMSSKCYKCSECGKPW